MCDREVMWGSPRAGYIPLLFLPGESNLGLIVYLKSIKALIGVLLAQAKRRRTF